MARLHKLHGTLLVAALACALSASAAMAGCYADYKAKRDNPLRLHYGVMALPDAACRKPEDVARLVGRRLEKAGWHLLRVLSVFDETGLESRKDNAGAFYLRY